jgi:hypothetical protein
MFIRKFITTAALWAATLVPTLTSAAATGRPSCILNDHRIVSVEPYRVDRHIGKFTTQEVRGAQVYLTAEPSLTKEWLQLTLQHHVAEMQGSATMPDCVFALSNVRVDVASAGPGFWVRLIGPDSKTGQEIFRRAELLAGS